MTTPRAHFRFPLSRVLILVVAALAAVLGIPGAASAQTEETPTLEPGSAPVFVPGARVGTIELKVVSVGIGNGARPGDWCGVQVEVLNRSDKIRNVLIRLSEFDPDGDRALREGLIVANPGVRQRLWLYTRFPFGTQVASEGFTVSAYEAVETTGSSTGNDGLARYDAGALLGSIIHRPMQLTSPYAGLIGIVGSADAGLDQYQAVPANASVDYAPAGHELTQIIRSLTPASLPDRWQGYMSLDALVWSATGPAGSPQSLTPDQSAAIREWIHRGGHLIVILPPSGQEWLGRRDHLMTDLMPAAALRTLEGVSLEPYRPLLISNRQNRAPLPKNVTVHTFEPQADAGPGEAVRVLNGPDGRCVVARRLVGAGMVTIVGLDVASSQLDRAGGVEADAIWNRILGRRVDTLGPEELRNYQMGRQGQYFGPGSRPERFLEAKLPEAIQKTGRAATGLFLAFIVFLAYWLVAGPVGYFVLRQRGWKQHAWVAFLAAAAVFTGIAWGGATLLKPSKVDVGHISLLDHVYGQPNQRVRSWVNIMLPEYGTLPVSVADDSSGAGPSGAGPGGTGDSKWHNSIAAWDPPPSGSLGGTDLIAAFLDARAYRADGRDPEVLSPPARATVKQFQIDWAGPARWKMPAPQVAAEGAVPVGREIRIVDVPNPKRNERSWYLSGTLVHGLPGPLEDVLVIVVRRQAVLTAAPSRAVIGNAFMFNIGVAWKPGETLELDKIGRGEPEAKGMNLAVTYLDDKFGQPGNNTFGVMDPAAGNRGTITDNLNLLSLYSVLPPPSKQPNQSSYVARRQATHGWDLGPWFTQPCVIIIGQLASEECPAPIRVDGNPVPSSGRTVVRWIYPLPDSPPEYHSAAEAGTSGETPEEGPSDGGTNGGDQGDPGAQG